MSEIKQLVQIPLIAVAVRLTWSGLSKKQKDERLTEMWVAAVMAENPLLYKGLEAIYDWCANNYD